MNKIEKRNILESIIVESENIKEATKEKLSLLENEREGNGDLIIGNNEASLQILNETTKKYINNEKVLVAHSSPMVMKNIVNIEEGGFKENGRYPIS